MWEPILFSDWGKPGSAALARLSDPRVAHFWDDEHLLAKQMDQDARPPQPEPECCRKDGVLWDLAALYNRDAVWTDTMPPAVLFDGAVVRKQSEIEQALLRMEQTR